MDPRTGRAAFRIAFLILGTAVAILPFQRPDSAEFVVTLMAVAIGLLFVGIVLIMARLSSPSLPPRGTAGLRDNAARTSFNASNEDSGGTNDRD